MRHMRNKTDMRAGEVPGLWGSEGGQGVPELQGLARPHPRAPVISALADQLGLEEAGLGRVREAVEGKRGPDLGVEVLVTLEVDHRERLPAVLGEQRPVVDQPELLPPCRGELRVTPLALVR